MEKRPGLLSFPLKKVVMVDGLRQLVDKERSFLNRSGIRILAAAVGSNRAFRSRHHFRLRHPRSDDDVVTFVCYVRDQFNNGVIPL